jgi:hypothetical protein
MATKGVGSTGPRGCGLRRSWRRPAGAASPECNLWFATAYRDLGCPYNPYFIGRARRDGPGHQGSHRRATPFFCGVAVEYNVGVGQARVVLPWSPTPPCSLCIGPWSAPRRVPWKWTSRAARRRRSSPGSPGSPCRSTRSWCRAVGSTWTRATRSSSPSATARTAWSARPLTTSLVRRWP